MIGIFFCVLSDIVSQLPAEVINERWKFVWILSRAEDNKIRALNHTADAKIAAKILISAIYIKKEFAVRPSVGYPARDSSN